MVGRFQSQLNRSDYLFLQWHIIFRILCSKMLWLTSLNVISIYIGLSLSSNAKWHAHIENTITSESKLLGIMRARKYKLSRKALNNIYIFLLYF